MKDSNKFFFEKFNNNENWLERMGYFRVRMLFFCIGLMDQLYYIRIKKPQDVYVINDISYLNDNLREHRMNLSRLYKGEDKEKILPIIVNIHGGAWVYGDKNSYYSCYGMDLAQYGFGVFTINYRLVPMVSLRDQIVDVLCAIEYITKNAMKYGLDTSKIYLVGDSAGAYLASYIGVIVCNQELIKKYNLSFLKNIRALGLNCGIYDFNTFLGKDVCFPCKKDIVRMVFKKMKKNKDNNLTNFSVLNSITNDYIPSYVMGTKADGIFMETDRIVKIMKHKKVIFESTLYPKSARLPHDFHLKRKYPESKVTMQKMLTFFKRLS